MKGCVIILAENIITFQNINDVNVLCLFKIIMIKYIGNLSIVRKLNWLHDYSNIKYNLFLS